ncbi:protocatechuate 3,4-dioxygenase [Pigmentiphaga kullae]|uniref:3-O-methylgallate 3,4-dioxygenase n=1 Tax=Pigmentiphaga kullae TaxID=151784 RepID=A0A4Q7NPW2_9BURK|nr:protocatechuate 3,4-dioxygenase [Pigmentiphaga kullae]RZS86610.1 3-O-methylgallate 3,4-dioxygenase [Pigmentiphaga kullae]
MAEIVLGIASSHGPMLSTPPEKWGQRVEADKAELHHAYRGSTYSFDGLSRLRRSEGLEEQIRPEVWQSRHSACQAAIANLAEVFHRANPDIAIIVGNDQMELFTDANIPAFAMYWGETILNHEPKRDPSKPRAPGLDVAMRGRIPEGGAEYPGHGELARHLILSAMRDGFDVAALKEFPQLTQTVPHAYGFVYRQIMRDNVVPSVPVFTNTFYPPNQPTAQRCSELGYSLARAIESWPGDERVALIASGGLSHFVIDEEIDRLVIESIKDGDLSSLQALPETHFQSGTSEIKNWIPVMAAMSQQGLRGKLVDYVPCYRSEAGTGNAMGFAYWSKEA